MFSYNQACDRLLQIITKRISNLISSESDILRQKEPEHFNCRLKVGYEPAQVSYKFKIIN